MNYLKRETENRLDSLKKEEEDLEKAMEDVSHISVATSSIQPIKLRQLKLSKDEVKLKRKKERTEAAEKLAKRVYSGLVHVGKALGLDDSHDVTNVTSEVTSKLQLDIDNILERIIDEREKQLQGAQYNTLATVSETSGTARSNNLQQVRMKVPIH